MSDDFNRHVQQRMEQEYRELDNPIVQRQLQLDRFWQSRLDARAAARRRALGDLPGGEDAESGRYDPIARFEREG